MMWDMYHSFTRCHCQIDKEIELDAVCSQFEPNLPTSFVTFLQISGVKWDAVPKQWRLKSCGTQTRY